jgi:hypothetical protein
MILLYIYLACLLLSAVAATTFRKYLGSRRAIIFIPYLWYVFAQETGMVLASELGFLTKTGIIYNFYRPICTTVFVFFYYRLPLNAPVRKLITWMHAVYLTVTLVTFLFIKPVTEYNSYLSLASGFVIAFCGIFFLFNYFNLDNTEEEKHWQPVIWITIGITTFYPVVNFSLAFYKSLLAYNANILGVPLYQLIPRLMSIFMYSCFSYAFYLCKKKN